MFILSKDTEQLEVCSGFFVACLEIVQSGLFISSKGENVTFTFSAVTRSNSWSWSNCMITTNVSGAKSITRAGSWRN